MICEHPDCTGHHGHYHKDGKDQCPAADAKRGKGWYATLTPLEKHYFNQRCARNTRKRQIADGESQLYG